MDTEKDSIAKKVVDHMMEHDLFSQWLGIEAVSYTHLRAHETVLDLVCRLLLEKTKSSPNHTESTSQHYTYNKTTTYIDITH